MKKIVSILLTIAMLLATCGAFAEGSKVEILLPSDAMPTNNETDEIEDEGGEGTVTVAEGRETTGQSMEETVEGFAPEGLDKVVIGKDDRVTVSQTSEYPYSAIANMKVVGECGEQWECTGFMIGKNCLLTAAHCMICSEHRKWAQNVTFYFGYKSNSNYLYKYTGGWRATAGTSFPKGKYDAEALMDDWCYVIFDQDIGEKTGWFGFGIFNDAAIDYQRFVAAGYRDNKLKYCWGNTYVCDDKVIAFDADDVQGNSGGPIYSDQIVMGIVAAESNDAQMNYGRRITDEMWEFMLEDGYKGY